MAKVHTIEDQFQVIETAVTALESGELPLEEALKRYEQGLIAVRQAKAMLDKYQNRLAELRGADSAGNAGDAGDAGAAP